MRISFHREQPRYLFCKIWGKVFWLNSTFPFLHWPKMVQPNVIQRWLSDFILKLINEDPRIRHRLAMFSREYGAFIYQENGEVRIHWNRGK